MQGSPKKADRYDQVPCNAYPEHKERIYDAVATTAVGNMQNRWYYMPEL